VPKATFIPLNGDPVTVEGREGYSLMRASVDNRLAGIRGACGGAAACGTCHVYVQEPWLSMLPPIGHSEDSMLDGVWDVRANSRLACQIKLSAALDGITVELPERQG